MPAVTSVQGLHADTDRRAGQCCSHQLTAFSAVLHQAKRTQGCLAVTDGLEEKLLALRVAILEERRPMQTGGIRRIPLLGDCLTPGLAPRHFASNSCCCCCCR